MKGYVADRSGKFGTDQNKKKKQKKNKNTFSGTNEWTALKLTNKILKLY